MKFKPEVEEAFKEAYKKLIGLGIGISVPQFYIKNDAIMAIGDLVPRQVIQTILVRWDMGIPSSLVEKE